MGRDNDWQEQVGILPQVVEGLRLLNTIPDAGIYMITNQAGAAISDFPLLTEERVHEVCRYVVDVLKGEGANLDGHFLCPHATPEYAARKPATKFHAHLVHDCHCLKPGLGMVFDALKAEGITPDNADLYVIGDRASDVRTALNIGGIGVLIPFVNEPGESDKVAEMAQPGRIHVAQDMLAAAEFIISQRIIPPSFWTASGEISSYFGEKTRWKHRGGCWRRYCGIPESALLAGRAGPWTCWQSIPPAAGGRPRAIGYLNRMAGIGWSHRRGGAL